MISEIKERCAKANAIILAHYYQAPEIQDIAMVEIELNIIPINSFPNFVI